MEEKMRYQKFGKLGYRVSQLGLGAMRLPTGKDGKVDYDKAVPLIRRAIDSGINFIDSHHFYHQGESEIAVGGAIKGVRDKVFLQTKTPMYEKVNKKILREWLEKALRKLGTDYIDFYLTHSLGWEDWVKKNDLFLRFAHQLKKEGLIRHLGFSSHDEPEKIKKYLDSGEFETMTVQYNLLDQRNEEVISYAAEKGLGVVVMGPVGGGVLATPSEEINQLIPGGSKSSAEIALRFVLSHPGVSVALSGMSNLQQLEENVKVAEEKVLLSREERRRIEEILEEKRKLAELFCTGCGYCMPCPQGVNIPLNFRQVNLYRVYGLKEYARKAYFSLSREGKENLRASSCRECGECEPKCPQKISIIEQLKQVKEIMEGGL